MADRLEPLHLRKMVELCLKLVPRFFRIDFQVQIGGFKDQLHGASVRAQSCMFGGPREKNMSLCVCLRWWNLVSSLFWIDFQVPV